MPMFTELRCPSWQTFSDCRLH